jgi:hypothetical protein
METEANLMWEQQLQEQLAISRKLFAKCPHVSNAI